MVDSTETRLKISLMGESAKNFKPEERVNNALVIKGLNVTTFKGEKLLRVIDMSAVIIKVDLIPCAQKVKRH